MKCKGIKGNKEDTLFDIGKIHPPKGRGAPTVVNFYVDNSKTSQ